MTEPIDQDDELASVRQALAGQYHIERELGRGGMGVVYLAQDVQLDRRVAVKVLPPLLRREPELRERFLREARTAGQLSHPNIVPVFRADDLAGHAFFVMGLVEGESLAERVRARGPLPAADAVRILREVAWALAYAHARGVIHRDVKPENILLDRESGRAMVTDFGIAWRAVNPALTEDGRVMGTAHFMSPEQVAGESLDGRSDLYALGVVGYFILSGQLPFERRAASAVLVAHATEAPPALHSAAPGVPRAVAAVIDQCLRKDPGERYPSGEALAEALDKALEAAAQAAARASGDTDRISSEAAAAIWRRAAQLQASAAQRLEVRMLDGQDVDRDLPPGTTGYRLKDVEAAAIEAGISQQFVALALAEQPPATTTPTPTPGWREEIARRFLGVTDPTLIVTRAIEGPPVEILRALGQVCTGYPYDLILGDGVGGHPLDGGVINFEVQPFRMADANDPGAMRFRYYFSAARIRRLQVTLHPGTVHRERTEVRIFADLREDARRDAVLAIPVVGAGVVGGGAASAAIGAAVAGLGGLAVLPGLAGAAVVGGLTALAYRGMHRYSSRTIQRLLTEMLQQVASAVRSQTLFGASPLPRRRPPAGGDDQALSSLIISS